MLSEERIEQLIDDYYAVLKEMDGTKWAAKFSEKATIEDPVGTPMIAEGREIFCQFYTNAVNANFQTLDIQAQME